MFQPPVPSLELARTLFDSDENAGLIGGKVRVCVCASACVCVHGLRRTPTHPHTHAHAQSDAAALGTNKGTAKAPEKDKGVKKKGAHTNTGVVWCASS